jgi:hypothetical protein
LFSDDVCLYPTKWQTKQTKGKNMNEWQKFNDDVLGAIEEPTKKQKFEMNSLHFAIYELNQEKVSLSKSLDEVNKKIDSYMKELDQLITSDSPPTWAWRWIFKKSNIKWKNEFIKRLGQPEANKILSVAKQKEYPKIGIQFIDPNPEDIPKNPNQLKIPKRLTLPKPKLSLKDRIALRKGS